MKRERTLSALADSVTALYTFSVRADWKQFDLDVRLWKLLEAPGRHVFHWRGIRSSLEL